MKGVIGWSLAGLAVSAAVAGYAAEPPPKLEQPAWAYAVPLAPAVPLKDDGAALSAPGSAKRFTRTQINDEWSPKDPPGVADWFPGEHPPMPRIVAEGDKARGIRACSLCHYPNGKGRPENAGIAGLPKDYFIRQLNDMAAGTRQSAEPLKANAPRMAGYAKAMTDQEKEEAAAYFAALPWTPWIKVVETAAVPKMWSSIGMYLPLTGAEAGSEPIGQRVIETPEDPERSEVLRDPHSPFIAYVPPGAVAEGKALATAAEGVNLPCAACHGPGLKGAGAIPGIAGRSPSYIARQLNDFRRGTRHGAQAALMAPEAAGLTDEDLVNLSAYVASLPP